MASQRPITPLIPSVISRIRSGCQVSCFPQAVEEVVSNSLDADSSMISVFIDPKEYSFRVEDDGCGVQAAQFGYLCEAHCTSKIRTSGELREVPVSFGFRGEALACIAQMSLVHITSRARGSFESMSKVIRGGEVLKCGVSMTPRTEYGTAVSVRNFMFNKPVRQRQAINSKHKGNKELSQIQNSLFRMLLPFPHVGLIVHICGESNPILHLDQGRTRDWSLQSMFSAEVKHLVPVSATDDLFAIEGNILLPPSGHYSKEKQFLFINGCSVHSRELSGMMREMLHLANTQDDRKTNPEYAKHPGFFLNISAPRCSYYVQYGSGRATVLFQNDQKVLALARTAVMAAWGCESLDNARIGHRSQNRNIEMERCHPLVSEILEPHIHNHNDENLRKDLKRASLGNVSRAYLSSCHRGLLTTSLESRERSFVSIYPAKSTLVSCDGVVQENRRKCDRLGKLQSSLTQIVDSKKRQESVLCVPFTTSTTTEKVTSDSRNGHNRKRLKTLSYDRGKDRGLLLNIRGCNADQLDQGKTPDRQYDAGSNLNHLYKKHGLEDHFQNKYPLFSAEDQPICTGSPEQECGVALEVPQHHQFCSSQIQSQWDIDVQENLSDECSLFSVDSGRGCRPRKGVQLNFAKSFVEQPSFPSDIDYELDAVSSYKKTLCYDTAQYRFFKELDQGASNSKKLQDLHSTESKQDVIGSSQKQRDLSNCVENSEGINNDKTPPQPPSPRKGRAFYKQCPRRALSAPPHPRRCHRGYHSNPLKSLKTFGSNVETTAFSLQVGSDLHNPFRGTFRGVQSTLSTKMLGSSSQLRSPRCSYSLMRGDSTAEWSLSIGHETCMDEARSSKISREVNMLDTSNVIEKSCQSFVKHVKFVDDGEDMFSAVKHREYFPADLHNTYDGERGNSTKSSELQENPGVDADTNDDKRSSGLKNILKHFQNPCIGPPVNLLDNIASIEEFGPIQALVPLSISRAVFEDANILSQIGKKFIVMVCGGVLVAVDQHAADERVRIEMLQTDLLNTGGKFGMIKSQLMDAPQWLHLTHFEQQVFQTYKHKVESWGWKGELELETGKLKLTHLPVLFGSSLNATELKIYLHHLEDTSGSDVLPPCAIRVLKSKACRSAIMFGDELCGSECNKLIQSLRSTTFCFSCAHGRPTMAPLANIVSFKAAAHTKRISSGYLRVPKKDMSLSSLHHVLNNS